MIIRVEKNQFLDTDQHDITYLERLKMRLVDEKIKLQIMVDEASDRGRFQGDYMEPQKFRRMQYHLSHHKELIQSLSQAIADKKRIARLARNNADVKLSDFFMKEAKRRMEPRDYEVLVESAMKKMQEFIKLREDKGEEMAFHYVDQ